MKWEFFLLDSLMGKSPKKSKVRTVLSLDLGMRGIPPALPGPSLAILLPMK